MDSMPSFQSKQSSKQYPVLWKRGKRSQASLDLESFFSEAKIQPTLT